MKKNNIALEKSKLFSNRIVKLYKYLSEKKREYVLSKQVLRSGTGIGANIAESEYAISSKDFVSKIYIALKECGETIYWLGVLHDGEYITDRQYKSMLDDCEEIRRILSATSKTLKEKTN